MLVLSVIFNTLLNNFVLALYTIIEVFLRIKKQFLLKELLLELEL